MQKLVLLFLLSPLYLIGQVQIGNDIDGEGSQDNSGYAVSLSNDGSIVAIGAIGNNGNSTDSGHVRVYENQSGSWIQLGGDINGEAANDSSGKSVSLSGDGSVLAIGAIGNDGNGTDSGHVRIYEYDSGTWTQIGNDIDGEAANDVSGWSVDLSNDGSIVAIGAIGNDGNGNTSGHTRIYRNNSGTWIQIGNDIEGEEELDASGYSVKLSSNGEVVAIGASTNDGSAIDAGHVRIYQNQSDTWVQIGKDIDGEGFDDNSGSSVSISSDGNKIAIGAFDNDGANGNVSGHVRVYQNLSGNWAQIGNDIDGEAALDISGFSVSLSHNGNIIAIGAPGNDDNGVLSGQVRVYQNLSGNWVQVGSDIDGEVSEDFSGNAVSLTADGRIVAIGARDNDGVTGPDSGHVRVYDLSSILSTETQVFPTFNLYPNPAKNQISIQLDKGTKLKEIIIYNELGEIVLSENETTINTSMLSAGIYIVEISTNKGKASKKLIKE